MPKAKKHPDAPKSAMSSYMWFCQDMREKIKTESPGLSQTDLMKELGSRWKELSDNDKVPFVKLAEDDKRRFELDKAKFLETHDSMKIEGDAKTKKGKKVKDPNEPKKPKSAYLFFTTENRPVVKEELGGDAKPTEIMKRLGEMWGELSEEDKVKYVKMSEKAKAEYQVALDAYKTKKANKESVYAEYD